MNWKKFKKIVSIFIIILLLIPAYIFAQDITSPGADYSVLTAYKKEQPLGSGNWVNMSAGEQDSVFVFCSSNPNAGALNAPGSGCTYQWSKYDYSSLQYVNYSTSQNIANLVSGGYKVIVNCGTTVNCYYAWVFVNNTIANLNDVDAGCAPFVLSGNFSKESNFTYYAPPDDPFTIDANTQIEVCFTASHTFVSDLGFYLIAPGYGYGTGCNPGAAQPGMTGIVELLPAVSNWTTVTDLPTTNVSCEPAPFGINTNCNNGNNLNNFCFTTELPEQDPDYTACVCDLPTPLTGTFASAGPWSKIYGQQVPAPVGTPQDCGWSIQIYDCEPVDTGYFKNATIKFIGNGVCGQSIHYYDSDAISEAIEDESCSAATASRYIIPQASIYKDSLVNYITSATLSINPGVWDTGNWGSPVVTSSSAFTRNINPPPIEDTWFILTVIDNYGCVKIDSVLFETLPTDATIVPAGPFCTNSGIQQLDAANIGGVWSSVPSGLIINASNGTIDPSVGDDSYMVYYTIDSICYDIDSTTIIVNPVITIQNLDYDSCVNSDTQYILEFDILGGSSFTVSINGGAFSNTYITGNHFEYIATSGTTTIFKVTSTTSCDTLTSSVYTDCGCATNAGIMPQTPIVRCEGDLASAVSSNSNLQPNDALVYYLHSGNFLEIISPIDSNFTGTFPTNSLTNIVYGQQYYISAVAADSLSNGYINWADTCKYVSVGTPVKWLKYPIANAGTAITTCGNVAQLNATPPDVGQGFWSSPDCSGSIFYPYFDSPTASVTNAGGFGTCVYKWEVTNDICVSSSNVTVNFIENPAPFAGYNELACGLSYQLVGTLSVSGSIGTWSGSDATFSSITNNSAIVTVNDYGTYTFTFKEDVGGTCSGEDYIDITFKQQPNPFIGYNDSLCGFDYQFHPINVNFSGEWKSVPFDGSINWYNSSGTLYSTPPYNDPNSKVNVNYSLNSQSYCFEWDERNGECIYRDTVCINFAKPTVASVNTDSSDLYVCGNEANLYADLTGAPMTDALWYAKVPGVVFSSFDSTFTTMTIPTSLFGDLSYVDVDAIWLIKNMGCYDFDTIPIRFFQQSEPFAGIDTVACGKIIDSLNAEYGLGNGTNASGSWIKHSGPGTATFYDHTTGVQQTPGSNNMDNNIKIIVDTYGEYEFVWSVKNTAPGVNNLSTPCFLTDTIKVEFIKIPFIDAGDSINNCGRFNICLDADTSTVKDSATWVSETGISYFNPSSPITCFDAGISKENQSFYLFWREWVKGCKVEDSVKVTIVKQPVATINVTKLDECGKVYNDLTAPSTGINTTGYWVDSTLTLLDPTVFTPNIYSNPVNVTVSFYGKHDILWILKTTIDNFSCYDTSVVIPITFWPQPAPDAGPDSAIACGHYFALSGVQSAGDTSRVTWSSLDADLTYYSTGYTLDSLGRTINDTVFLGPINVTLDKFRDIVLTEKIGPNDMCSATDKITVHFVDIPNGDFTFTEPKCFGDTFSFSATDNLQPLFTWTESFDTLYSDSVSNFYYAWTGDTSVTTHNVTLVSTNIYNCPSIPVTKLLTEPPVIKIDFDVTDAECSYYNGSLTATASGGLYHPLGYYTYTWGSPITTNVNNQTQDSLYHGRYIVSVSDAWDCEVSDTVFIQNLGATVVANFDTQNFQPSYNAPASITFTNMSIDANYYVWYFNNSNQPGLIVDIKDIQTNSIWNPTYTFNPKVQFLNSGAKIDTTDNPTFTYDDGGDFWVFLIAISEYGCVDTMYYYKIHVEYLPVIEVPNVFTPNGDGINDLFTIKVKSLQSFSGVIFNRWGHKVYEWNDPADAGWDGKVNGGSLASPGTYYYMLEGVGKDGTEFSPKTENCEDCKGFLQLIRD